MYRIENCPSCGSQNVIRQLSQLAQFIVWMATGEFTYDNSRTYAVVCNDCSFIGSGLRLTQEEDVRLYSNHKGEDYTNKRIFCEPWYKEYIEKFDRNKYLHERRTRIDTLIDKNIDRAYINTVLDVWGGSGEHIPIRFIKAKKYVHNIVTKPLLPQVIDLSPLTRHKPIDFIMCCNVLEYQSDPASFIQIIKNIMNKDSWLYVEMSYSDDPDYDVFHEQVNFWNPKSFTVFLDRFGFTAVDHSISDGVISLLVRLK